MGLSYRDKEQLLQLGSLLLPAIMQVGDSVINEPKREKARASQAQMEDLKTTKLLQDISKNNKDLGTPDNVSLSAANKLLGRDLSGFASKSASGEMVIPMSSFRTLVSTGTSIENQNIKKSELTTKKQERTEQGALDKIKSIQNSINDTRNLLSRDAPFTPGIRQQFTKLQADAANNLPELEKQLQEATKEFEAFKSGNTTVAIDKPDSINNLSDAETIMSQKNIDSGTLGKVIQRYITLPEDQKTKALQDLQKDFGITPEQFKTLAIYHDKVRLPQ